jgi:hypothetical protein
MAGMSHHQFTGYLRRSEVRIPEGSLLFEKWRLERYGLILNYRLRILPSVLDLLSCSARPVSTRAAGAEGAEMAVDRWSYVVAGAELRPYPPAFEGRPSHKSGVER